MNRRDLFKIFGGGAAGIPAIKSIERLELGPKDTLVFTFQEYISQEHAEHIRKFAEEKFPGQKIMVLSGGLDVKVLRQT